VSYCVSARVQRSARRVIDVVSFPANKCILLNGEITNCIAMFQLLNLNETGETLINQYINKYINDPGIGLHNRIYE